MAHGKDTEEMLAARFPHSHHLFNDLENICGIIKTQNNGKAHVSFDAQGIDPEGNIIVKAFEASLRFFRHKKEYPSDLRRQAGY